MRDEFLTEFSLKSIPIFRLGAIFAILRLVLAEPFVGVLSKVPRG